MKELQIDNSGICKDLFLLDLPDTKMLVDKYHPNTFSYEGFYYIAGYVMTRLTGKYFTNMPKMTHQHMVTYNRNYVEIKIHRKRDFVKTIHVTISEKVKGTLGYEDSYKEKRHYEIYTVTIPTIDEKTGKIIRRFMRIERVAKRNYKKAVKKEIELKRKGLG